MTTSWQMDIVGTLKEARELAKAWRSQGWSVTVKANHWALQNRWIVEGEISRPADLLENP